MTAGHGKTHGESVPEVVRLGQKNGPGPGALTLGEFPDLTTLGVASDR